VSYAAYAATTVGFALPLFDVPTYDLKRAGLKNADQRPGQRPGQRLHS